MDSCFRLVIRQQSHDEVTVTDDAERSVFGQVLRRIVVTYDAEPTILQDLISVILGFQITDDPELTVF